MILAALELTLTWAALAGCGLAGCGLAPADGSKFWALAFMRRLLFVLARGDAGVDARRLVPRQDSRSWFFRR
jgi:hypothetical protein